MECFREVIVENAEISWVSSEIYSSKEKKVKDCEERISFLGYTVYKLV